MRLVLAALLALTAAPALAGVPEVVDRHILPAFSRFADATETLAETAQADCMAPAVRPAYQTAFDAWMGLSHLQFGPLEQDGRALSIAFWPDKRGMVARTVNRLIADQDPVVDTPDGFAEVSVAGRGLFALDRVLYDPQLSGYGPGDYTCQLVTALSADLARVARDMRIDWDGFAETLLTAGADGNTTYLAPREAAQGVYTALVTGLEFTKDQRLGRPLGTFDRPRPTMAEAWRSGRSLKNVELSLIALHELAGALADGPIPQTDAAFDAALETAAELDDPIFAGVSDPTGRLRVEILQQKVRFIQDAVAGEIGTALGLSAGFNSQDGD